MFGKSKPAVNVEESVAAVMKCAEQDQMFNAILQGIMAQDAIRMKAMVTAWISELKSKGSPAEVITAATTLQNMDVAREVRRLVKK
jgi:cytidine deaminase